MRILAWIGVALAMGCQTEGASLIGAEGADLLDGSDAGVSVETAARIAEALGLTPDDTPFDQGLDFSCHATFTCGGAYYDTRDFGVGGACPASGTFSPEPFVACSPACSALILEQILQKKSCQQFGVENFDCTCLNGNPTPPDVGPIAGS
jgi:hypothetical protein